MSLILFFIFASCESLTVSNKFLITSCNFMNILLHMILDKMYRKTSVVRYINLFGCCKPHEYYTLKQSVFFLVS